MSIVALDLPVEVVEITPALLDQIKQAAQAATAYAPRQWTVHPAIETAGWGVCVGEKPHGDIFARMTGRNQLRKQAIAEHSAALSPCVALALIAEIERLRGDLR